MKKMLIEIFEKIFCKHKWETHEKVEYSYTKVEIVEGTEDWFEPKTEEINYSDTVEILICEKCGKIKKIKY